MGTPIQRIGWEHRLWQGDDVIEIRAAAVLFDNDGVLVDSHEDGLKAWQQLCDEFGLDFSEIVEVFVGRRPEDTLSEYVEPALLELAVGRLEDLEVSLADNTRLLAGAGGLLSSLADAPWAIATSAGVRLAKARWAGAGIETGVTVTAEDVGRGKPDPEPYLLAADRLGVNPSDCIVFEDSPSGGIAGREAGARVVAVGDFEWSFEPDVRVPDLSFVEVITATSAGVTLRFG